MRLPQPLYPGKLLKRYKRFLVDIELADGTIVTAHCADSGSMSGLLEVGNPVLLSRSSNARRKLAHTWELVRIGPSWVGVNTMNANRIVGEALLNKQIPQLSEYSKIKPEAVWDKGCRFDFELGKEERRCYVEVKNVTLAYDNVARFPDAKTERGVKHLQQLIQVVQNGHRAVQLYLVHRGDCTRFEPAHEIDPLYAETLQRASNSGVEILVYRTTISPPDVEIDGEIEFEV